MLSLVLCLTVTVSCLGSEQFERSATLLLDGKAKDLADAQRELSGVSGIEQIGLAALAFELYGEPAKRVEILLPQLEKRRSIAQQCPAATCSLADALASLGQFAQAREILALLDIPDQSLTEVACDSVRARLALKSENYKLAQDILVTARKMLHKLVPDEAYATWESRLIHKRLKSLEQLLKIEANKNKTEADRDLGGEAYLAWKKADESGEIENYKQLREGYPKTIFADAAHVQVLRLLIGSDLYKEALQQMVQQRHREQGYLGVEIKLLRGDLLMLSGKLKNAQQVYTEALTLLSSGLLPKAEGLSELLVTQLKPAEPLHRFDSWLYPVWDVRPKTCILAPQFDAGIEAYWRYRLIARIGVIHYANGKRSLADQLAQSLLVYDYLDRQMAVNGAGPGGLILSHTFKTDSFLLPLNEFTGVSTESRAAFLMAMSMYQVYDWRECVWWLNRCRISLPSRELRAIDMVNALAAYSEKMQRNYDKALELADRVHLHKGEKPHLSWYRARQVEWEFYQKDIKNFDKVMNIFTEVQRQAPGTEYAKNTQLYQAMYAENKDLKLSLKLFYKYRDDYPGEYTESIEYFINTLLQKIKIKDTQ